jgi:DNA-binding MarR family transcriptional regulator
MTALEVARAASEAFRLIDPNIGAQTITVLLTVAENDGRIIVSDLERLCALTRESASRNVKLLSSAKLKDGRHGYGLVEKRADDQDDRRKILALTRSGRQMIDMILNAIAPGGKT